jgi:type IV pilus assembly protein PilQ
MKLFNTAVVAIATTCLALAGSAVAQTAAANSIEAINASPQGTDIAIRIDLREPLQAPPAGFSVANPPKIAFDLQSTANALGKSNVTFNEGNLRSINVVQVGERTRLVLNLARNMNYSTRLDGKSLYVLLKPIESVGDSLAERATRFTEASSIAKRHSVQDIAFRRGKDGEGRVVVDLSDPGAGIDIRQQGRSLIVDFIKTGTPEHLRRKLDVTDFGTPVSSIETRVMGDNTRMTITPQGQWEHNAYQADNQFVVEVKKIVEDPNKLVQGTKTGYQGPRVSINYQNGDVRALLRLMAEELGLNAVISETVTGSTTLVLKDVPADQVIDIIFQQKGLDMRKKGNILLIAPRDEIATREKLEFESRQQISDLEPLKMEQFVLNYQKAGDVARLLAGLAPAGAQAIPGQAQRILSKRGSAVAEPQANLLFVNDIPSKLEEIRAFIRAIDIGARQVLIEARVVEASDTFQRDLGVRMNYLSTRANQIGGSGIYGGGGQYTTPTQSFTQSIDASGNVTTSGTRTPGAQTTPNTLGVNLPSFSNVGGTLAFSLFNSSLTRILNLEVAALETDGLGKVISSPRVITANNVKAKIDDGTEIPYTTTVAGGGVATQNVSFKSAKLSLEATPQITPEGTIRMQLLVKKEEPDWTRAVLGNPPIKSATVETSVVVENGGTVVIGGVFITKTQTGTEKVPLLGDIPFVGWLFKYNQKLGERRELLFFITPRIISDKLNLN